MAFTLDETLQACHAPDRSRALSLVLDQAAMWAQLGAPCPRRSSSKAAGLFGHLWAELEGLDRQAELVGGYEGIAPRGRQPRKREIGPNRFGAGECEVELHR